MKVLLSWALATVAVLSGVSLAQSATGPGSERADRM